MIAGLPNNRTHSTILAFRSVDKDNSKRTAPLTAAWAGFVGGPLHLDPEDLPGQLVEQIHRLADNRHLADNRDLELKLHHQVQLPLRSNGPRRLHVQGLALENQPIRAVLAITDLERPMHRRKGDVFQKGQLEQPAPYCERWRWRQSGCSQYAACPRPPSAATWHPHPRMRRGGQRRLASPLRLPEKIPWTWGLSDNALISGSSLTLSTVTVVLVSFLTRVPSTLSVPP